MSSTTRLLVLGAVRLFQPVHGYEVRRELMSWRAHEWASIAPGSIYNALKSMTKEGLLEVVGTDQVGARPERTSYRLTNNGDAALRDLLFDTWWQVATPTDPLMSAISFLSLVPRDQAIAALEHRMTTVKGVAAQLAYLADHIDTTHNPEHVREMLQLSRARINAEVSWAQAFVARLRDGAYVTADDPPWQPAMHQIGEPAGKRSRGRSRANGEPKAAARTTSRRGSRGKSAQARRK
jgi:DNA-binding PadR family transcriptional regulator